MNNGQVTFTGSNADEVAATLGLYVYPHPTQAAIVLFAGPAAVDPLGSAAAGQTITVTGGNVVKVTGTPTGTQLPPPRGGPSGGPNYPTLAQVQALIAAAGGGTDQQSRDQLAAILAGSTDDKNSFAELAALILANGNALAALPSTYVPRPGVGAAVGSVPTKQADGSVAYAPVATGYESGDYS